MIGLFMEMLPLRVTIEEDDTFLSLSKKAQNEMLEARRHGPYAIGNPQHNQAYDVTFNYLNTSNASHRTYNGARVVGQARHLSWTPK